MNNRCVCCYSPATQHREGYYHCDDCASEYDEYRSLRNEGYTQLQCIQYSGYLMRDNEYMDLDECNVEEY